MRVVALGALALLTVAAACSDSDANRSILAPDSPSNATSTSVASVTVSPANASIAVGGKQQYTVTVKDVNGNTVTGARIVWRTSDTTVATIDANGLVKGVAAGKVYVRAKADGVLGKVPLTVTATTSSTAPTTSGGAGIPFGPFSLPETEFKAPWNGAVVGVNPSSLLRELKAARAGGARVVLRFARNRSRFQNSDGSFNLSLWKQEVNKFKGIDISSYIADGTVIGHYLFDEPQDPNNWNGKVVPYADIEGAAAYSKQLWPAMTTIMRAPPTWLAGRSSWQYLDAGWAQYTARRFGPADAYIAAEADAAQRAGLGLIAGLNVLDGGDGSSGLTGYTGNRSAMSATEIQKYAKAILANSAVCGFFLWQWNDSYFSRSDIQSAARAVATMAAGHAATSCR
ncbi:MAG TPA: Ig-like domain-containing protein [Gemmatimonadaceae bacterium]|nr:Ig-like domain-containing protein [Gemmatimonadaceae bacterium]